MYAIVQKSEGLPTVVNKNSFLYPDFIQSGYEVLHEGHKRDMEAIYDEMMLSQLFNPDYNIPPWCSFFVLN